jgi:pyridoxine 4-dehydrogenase
MHREWHRVITFFPLGSSFAADNPLLSSKVVQRTAKDLGRIPAQ